MGNINRGENGGHIIHKAETKEKYVYELIEKRCKNKQFWGEDRYEMYYDYKSLFKEVREMYIHNEKETEINPVIDHAIWDNRERSIILNDRINIKWFCWTFGVTSAYIAKHNLELSEKMIKAVAEKVIEELDLKSGALKYSKDFFAAKNKFEIIKKSMGSPKFDLVEKFLNKTPSELGL